jgi:hypothetical protein
LLNGAELLDGRLIDGAELVDGAELLDGRLADEGRLVGQSVGEPGQQRLVSGEEEGFRV